MTEKRSPDIDLEDSREPVVERVQEGSAAAEAKPKPSRNGEVHSSGLDPLAFIELLLRRWPWIVGSAALLAVLGVVVGKLLFHPSYSATVKLLRLDTQSGTEFYKPRQFSDQTYAMLLRAPELLERVATKANPPMSRLALNKSLSVTPVRDSEVIIAMVDGRTPEQTLDLANLYAAEAVNFTKQIQGAEAGLANHALKEQLAAMDAQMQELTQRTGILATTNGLAMLTPASRITALQDKLQAAQDELANLLSTYTTNWPPVKVAQAKIELLRKELTTALNEPQPMLAPTSRGVTSVPMPPGAARGTNTIGLQSDTLLAQVQAAAASRLTLASRQREAQVFSEKPPGYVQVLAPAAKSELIKHGTKVKLGILGVLGFMLGFGGALVTVMLVEFLDDRLKTTDDVKRVTHLPLLASLGDLDHMSPAAQTHWAFRTWTSLQSRLSISPNKGFVCGFTSSQQQEGRSTWVGLLAQAASGCGFRVLTIATDTPCSSYGVRQDLEDENTPLIDNEDDLHPSVSNGTSTALTTTVLSRPAMVTERLTGADPQPYVHIPLPGWVWNLERRNQWHSALSQWSRIDNVVILVELPPASCPESVLLGENLPNLVWLVDNNKARAGEVREQLTTLRDARCNLVGAVLNHEVVSPLKKRLSRWLGTGVMLAGSSGLMTGAVQAQPAFDQVPQPVVQATNSVQPAPIPAGAAAEDRTNALLSFSIISPTQKAQWQQRLTLGPGDALNISLFGQAADANRTAPGQGGTEIVIGPDGKISFLQAVEVQAAGLTIDELRNKLDEELGKYYRAPRTIINPVAFRSKKYFMLGKVTNRGVYVLDQPITLVEAVARAKGLETGLVDFQNTVDLADLQRSFLMRSGKQLPVDFQKLFQEGDLSQNVAIEPNDYIYIAAANLAEVYVLGEVNAPGQVLYTASTTVAGAIAARGGFTDKAFKGKVLVIRGSLNKPETFVVNVWGNLEGSNMGFKLQNKDIVYVAHRTFVRVEELLDLAATAFIQSAVASWAGVNVPPIFTSPVLPQTPP